MRYSIRQSVLAVTLAACSAPALARQTDVLVVNGTSVGIGAGLPEVIRTPFMAAEPGDDTIVRQVFRAYPAGFQGGVRVASGDVNGDGVADVITGTGAGAQSHVKVFDGRTGQATASFFPYGTGFTGGVSVAAGDVDGDGFADIITGAGPGSAGGHVKVFNGNSGAEMASFFTFPAGFSGGVHVAAGDVNGDGRADIVVGAGSGSGGGHVKVFNGNGLGEFRSFFAYPGTSVSGVHVAAGDINGDSLADIVVGPIQGVAPHVKVFDGASGDLIRSMFVFDTAFRGGVRVATSDIDSDGRDDILVAPGPGFGDTMPNVRGLSGVNNNPMYEEFVRDPNSAGLWIAGGQTAVRKPRCFGDANGDRQVNFADITATLSAFGRPCP